MKHKKILLTMLIAAAMATAGCSKSDTPDPSMPDSYEPSTTPIAFQTEYNWGDEEETKGALKEEFVKDDTFGVLAYYLNGGDWVNTTATPNFMYNQEVVFNGTDWTYSPLKYWSNNTTDRFRFYAYTPYSATIEPSPNTHAGCPYLTYTPSVNAPEMIDFMVASPVVAYKDEPSIVFEFKHQLAQLAFSAKHAGDEATTDGTQSADKVKITGITIHGISPHTGDFAEDGSFVWRSSANTSEKLVECVTDITNGGLIDSYIVNGETNDDFVIEDGYYRLTNTAGPIMMSPQTFSNAKDDYGNDVFEVGVEFDLIKSHGQLESDVVMNAATTMTFDPLTIEQGYTYNLRFELSINGYNYVILGSDIIREEWKVGGGNDFGIVE